MQPKPPASSDFFLLLVNAVFSTFLLLTIVPQDVLFERWQTTAFLPLALLGNFSFFLLPVYLLVRLSHFLVKKLSTKLLLVAGIYSLVILLVIIDVQVYGLYRFHINGMVLNLVTGGSALQILSFSWSMWLFTLIGFALLFAVQFYLAKYFYLRASHWRSGIVVFCVALIMAGTQLYYAYNDAMGQSSVTRLVRYIPWAQPVTAKGWLRDRGVTTTNKSTVDMGKKMDSALAYPKAELVCEATRPYNIIWVVIDSLRFDMLTPEIMPNTAALAASSSVFNQHYSAGNATRFGMFGLFYGLPSSYWWPILGEQRSSVFFDTLVEQDYQLFINASAPFSSPEFDRTAFSNIKDQLVTANTLAQAGKFKGEHADTMITNDLLEKMASRNTDKPFFGLLFLDAPHSFSTGKEAQRPFKPAWNEVNYLELDNDFDPEPFLNLYKNSSHYNDQLVGRLVAALSEQGLDDNTVLVVTSDHGQEFNETQENYWGHNSNFSDYQMKVPLVIRWPGVEARTIDQRTSHEDIVPTIMSDVLKCKNPVSDYSTGANLMDADYQSRDLVFESWSRRALFTGERYYVFEFGDVDVRDQNYRLLKNEQMDPVRVMNSMKVMSDFLQ